MPRNKGNTKSNWRQKDKKYREEISANRRKKRYARLFMVCSTLLSH